MVAGLEIANVAAAEAVITSVKAIATTSSVATKYIETKTTG